MSQRRKIVGGDSGYSIMLAEELDAASVARMKCNEIRE
jgi:hypothetical protein